MTGKSSPPFSLSSFLFRPLADKIFDEKIDGRRNIFGRKKLFFRQGETYVSFTEVNQVSELGCPDNTHMKYSKSMRILWRSGIVIFLKSDHETLERMF